MLNLTPGSSRANVFDDRPITAIEMSGQQEMPYDEVALFGGDFQVSCDDAHVAVHLRQIGWAQASLPNLKSATYTSAIPRSSSKAADVP